MRYGRAIIVDGLGSVELGRSHPVVYDREVGLRLLYQDPDSGAEHYLVRYPAGLKARAHRHTAAHSTCSPSTTDGGRPGRSPRPQAPVGSPSTSGRRQGRSKRNTLNASP
jgi:hypothetical protein